LREKANVNFSMSMYIDVSPSTVSESDGSPNQRDVVEKGTVGRGRAPEGSIGLDEVQADRTGQTEGRTVVGECNAPEHPVSSTVIWEEADPSSLVGALGCWLGVKNGVQDHRLKMRDESQKALTTSITENGSLTGDGQRP